jgi:hypothetical protein
MYCCLCFTTDVSISINSNNRTCQQKKRDYQYTTLSGRDHNYDTHSFSCNVKGLSSSTLPVTILSAKSLPVATLPLNPYLKYGELDTAAYTTVGLSLCLYICSYYPTGREGANSISITLSPSKVEIEHILCIMWTPCIPRMFTCIVSVTHTLDRPNNAKGPPWH